MEPVLEARHFRYQFGPVTESWAGDGELGRVSRWGCRSQEIQDLQRGKMIKRAI